MIHALIDAGRVTALECQYEGCRMKSRAFVPRTPGTGHQSHSVVVEHIVPQLKGGTDRLENLRIIHADCNVRRSAGWKMSAEARAKLSASATKREQWRHMRAAWTPECCVKTRPDDRRGGNRPRMFTDAQVTEIRERYAAGEIYSKLAVAFGTNITTIMHVVRHLEAYADKAA